ncbi:hypothetical protein FGE12_12430 [Aggregicoccus sp. 17bor-14]|uniref:hypothetical protein n=1 Tax=Myxococcaceae TaxID=31 RepID=UPI00129D1505|nr:MULTISPECIES: hypothetical protein [Myxococcaceae]MBF5043196.1 hypothetical protein [Simulacricoccus sp. 17bor-14]MRI88954.1 hypothetical protein [Aggregicoccus sp. 17bor-14]
MRQTLKRRWFPLVVVVLAAVSCGKSCNRGCTGGPACGETCDQCKERCATTQGVDPDTCMRTECASICQDQQKK